MSKLIHGAALALLLGPDLAAAQDFDVGLKSYNSGHYANAVREWRSLAKRGNARSQRALGIMYLDGLGVEQSDLEAVRWFRASAVQGDATGQYNLAYMYQEGRGVVQSYVTAHMWFNVASANESAPALEARNKLARKMSSDTIAEAQRRARVCLESGFQDCD